MSPRRELSAGKQPVLHVLPKKCISHPDTHSSVHPLPLSRASAGIHFPWTFYKCLSRASHSHSLTMAVTAILFLLRVSKGAREKWVFFRFQEDGHLCLSWQLLLCWGRGDALAQCTKLLERAWGRIWVPGMLPAVWKELLLGRGEECKWRSSILQGEKGKRKKKKKALQNLQLFGWGSGWLHFYCKCLVTQTHKTLSAHLGPRDAAYKLQEMLHTHAQPNPCPREDKKPLTNWAAFPI